MAVSVALFADELVFPFPGPRFLCGRPPPAAGSGQRATDQSRFRLLPALDFPMCRGSGWTCRPPPLHPTSLINRAQAATQLLVQEVDRILGSRRSAGGAHGAPLLSAPPPRSRPFLGTFPPARGTPRRVRAQTDDWGSQGCFLATCHVSSPNTWSVLQYSAVGAGHPRPAAGTWDSASAAGTPRSPTGPPWGNGQFQLHLQARLNGSREPSPSNAPCGSQQSA